MSSNVNLVDKLNPISFEQHETIKIDPKDPDRIRKTIEEDSRNNKINKENSNKDSKITIESSKTEMNLIKLEKLYDKCLSDLEIIKKKAIENNEIDIDIDYQLDTENSVKKKLLLNNLPQHLPKTLKKSPLNPLFKLF